MTRLPHYTFEAIQHLPVIWSTANFKDAVPGVVSMFAWSMIQEEVDAAAIERIAIAIALAAEPDYDLSQADPAAVRLLYGRLTSFSAALLKGPHPAFARAHANTTDAEVLAALLVCAILRLGDFERRWH